MRTNWATHAIEALSQGLPCQVVPHGNSMTPLVMSGDTVSLVPYTTTEVPQVGDIVLCKVRGNVYLHLVKAVRNNKGDLQFQIGNNHGGVNGWTNSNHIFGKRAEEI